VIEAITKTGKGFKLNGLYKSKKRTRRRFSNCKHSSRYFRRCPA
jgi:hypothetical protein